MSPADEIVLKIVSMLGKITIIRTDAAKSQGLAVCYTILAMSGMAAGRMKILVSVSGLSVQICGECVLLLFNGDIEEVDLFIRDFRCEFNGPVE